VVIKAQHAKAPVQMS